MLVSDVIKNVQTAKLLDLNNDQINATLTRMGKGKFTLKEKFGLAVLGVNTKDMQDMANCAKQVADADFGGDSKAAINFINQAQGTSLAKLDFNQLVHSGTADRLVALSKTDPDGFQKVLSGNYPDIQSLNKALGGPAQQAKVAAAPQAPRPAMA